MERKLEIERELKKNDQKGPYSDAVAEFERLQEEHTPTFPQQKRSRRDRQPVYHCCAQEKFLET